MPTVICRKCGKLCKTASPIGANLSKIKQMVKTMPRSTRRRGFQLSTAGYPFKPVRVIPGQRILGASKKAMRTGARLITVPAINTGQSVEYEPCILANPRGTVIFEIELIKTSGRM